MCRAHAKYDYHEKFVDHFERLNFLHRLFAANTLNWNVYRRKIEARFNIFHILQILRKISMTVLQW